MGEVAKIVPGLASLQKLAGSGIVTFWFPMNFALNLNQLDG
jgi:hypothetical protein